MTRTFIALEMNDAVQRHLDDVIHRVASTLSSLRWVDVHGIHLTLAFLGELDDVQLAKAIEAAQHASSQSETFAYRLSHLGIFGSVRQPRVLWMGIEEPSGALQHLHRTLNRELAQRGFEIDKRPFSPHLTLARGKVPLSAAEQTSLQSLLSDRHRYPKFSAPCTVSSIHVIKSELLRTGARYTILHSAPFKGVEER